MRINTKSEVMVLAKNERQGSNNKYYDAAILVDGQAGNFSCTEEAYALMVPNCVNELVWQYNTEYKSFRIVGCEHVIGDPNKKDKPVSIGKPADSDRSKAAAN